MEALIENARLLLETAVSGLESGVGHGEWTFFVGAEGGLQMIAGAEAPLESLAWSRGARAAWQVKRNGGKLRVEGLSGEDRCRLESPLASRAERGLLSESRLYVLAAPYGNPISRKNSAASSGGVGLM